MFVFSRVNDFLSFNFYFWNLNKHRVLETVTLFSSVGINSFKMSLLKGYQHSALIHELPLTKISQELYQFLLTKCPPFSVWWMFQADPGTMASKSLGLGEVILKNPYSGAPLQTQWTRPWDLHCKQGIPMNLRYVKVKKTTFFSLSPLSYLGKKSWHILHMYVCLFVCLLYVL